MTAQIKLNSTVKYLDPFEDEMNITYTVIEISEAENWCKIQANLGLNINPVYTANLTDLRAL